MLFRQKKNYTNGFFFYLLLLQLFATQFVGNISLYLCFANIELNLNNLIANTFRFKWKPQEYKNNRRQLTLVTHNKRKLCNKVILQQKPRKIGLKNSEIKATAWKFK